MTLDLAGMFFLRYAVSFMKAAYFDLEIVSGRAIMLEIREGSGSFTLARDWPI